jgi:hypothetical protein
MIEGSLISACSKPAPLRAAQVKKWESVGFMSWGRGRFWGRVCRAADGFFFIRASEVL